jgi:metal-responsive CopG/Arc/MetJ family transcriptional regulator
MLYYYANNICALDNMEATMRVTVHIPESVNNEIKRTAVKEKKSVSSFIAEAVQYYIKEKKRREIGLRVLELAGKVRISGDALEHIEEGRDEHDRS